MSCSHRLPLTEAWPGAGAQWAILAGVVGFHSSLATVAPQDQNIKGKVLVRIGADDPRFRRISATPLKRRCARVGWTGK